MASYSWLDLAVGSDTGGSIRGPAASQGLFGNRPSHGLVALDRVMPLSTRLDTAGFLVRDAALWDVAQSVLYGENYTSFLGGEGAVKLRYPTTVYTVGFPTNASAGGADALLVGFAQKLAAFVQGNVSELDIGAAWQASNLTEVDGVSLDLFMNLTYPVLIGREQTELVRDPFYADYAGESLPSQQGSKVMERHKL